jgi:uncharacterized membrane protein
MKKIIMGLIISLLIFTNVNAYSYGVENYYVDVTILENGDATVKEAFIMNGEFNGMERIIKYKNNLASKFYATNKYGNATSIQAGKDIIFNQIGSIKIPNKYDFNLINEEVDIFEEVYAANKGDYGKYTKRENLYNDGYTLMLYNPSRKKRAFYLEYTIKDGAVLHNDVGEFAWNLFSPGDFRESIKELIIKINIPNNKNEVRVWAHGPLHGTSNITNKNTLNITINGLDEGKGIDFRTIFDKEVIKNSTKKSGINALDQIVDFETNLANETNLERESLYKQYVAKADFDLKQLEAYLIRYRYDIAKSSVERLRGSKYFDEYNNRLKELETKLIEKEKEETIGSGVLFGIYALFLGFVTRRFYLKHDKEHKAEFDGKYYRDFPEIIQPSHVKYLKDKNITANEFSADLMYLIGQKVVKATPTGKSYTLEYVDKEYPLTPSLKKLVDMLFLKDTLELNKLKDRAKNSIGFATDFTSYCNKVREEGKSKKYFERKLAPSILPILLTMLGMFIGGAMFVIGVHTMLFGFLFLGLSFAALIYFATAGKRTVYGNNLYTKWKGLKNFLNDFGKFKDRDLPEVILWEMYLVYAMVFGIAKKLSKTMELKVKELGFDTMNTYDFYLMGDLSSSINRTIRQSVTASMPTSSSSGGGFSSSGEGFGGGFSGGGGGGGFSGGGGGGGGRF